MVCFGNFLMRNVTCFPDRPAIAYGDTVLTYAQLNEGSNRLAHSLAELGLKRGDRLALLMGSSVEWILIWYACQKLGIALLPLHVRVLQDELARTIELADCRALVYGAQFKEQASYIKTHCTVVGKYICNAETPDGTSYRLSELLANEDSSEAQVELGPDDECVILFTSGTTGVSKGVVRTQQMVRDHALVLAVEDEKSDDHEVILTPAPLYHTAGLLCVFKSAVLAGTLILLDRFDARAICAAIEKYKATQIFLLPPISYQRLYQSGESEEYDLRSVKLALLSAGKSTYECIMDIWRMFPNCKIRPSWGSTEVCSITGSNLSREDLEREPELMNTVGKINCLAEMRIVDENNNDVPTNVVGEAIVRSTMVFDGYLGCPGSRETCFVDGWFKTEDLMRKDERGYYYLMDRIKDMVKTGGENVYAQEVERVIQSHPSILDSAVIGVPDARFGEAIAAAIVLRAGCCLESTDFLEFCNARLPSFKKPRYWAIVDKLPENDVGKVQKTVLRKNAAQLFSKIC